MSIVTEQNRRRNLLQDFRCELRYAKQIKRFGRRSVSADVAGPGVAKGRMRVPIDEYIQHWKNGIEALAAGVDLELWNF